MIPWTDLVAPVLAFAAGLPAVTLALLLWRRTRDRSFELLATGLGLLAILAFLLSVGTFLLASRLLANPDLRFVLWNTTFLLSFVSLVVLRRFTSLVVPGLKGARAFPRLFSLISSAFYGTILVLAFGLTPPLLNFGGREVYALSAVYYALGFWGPIRRLWKARDTLPGWVSRLLRRGPWWLLSTVALLVTYESARMGGGGDSWPSLGPLAALGVFALVAVELFGILVTESQTAATPSQGDSSGAVARIAARCIAEPLTKREVEVLGLLLEGFRNQDIAERLGLSASTVKNHVYSVYQKTGAATRVELARMGEAPREEEH